MKLCIETYGCALNKADSKIIEAQLKNHELVSYENADIVVINTCGVKNKTESRMLSRIEKFLSDKKKVIVAGCLPKMNKELVERYPVAVVDLNSYGKLNEAIEKIEILPKYYSDAHQKMFPLLADFEKEVVVPISQGCLGNCSYCGVKNARGQLTSYPLEDIVGYIKNQVKQGKKKILLTSQDTGCYGRDIETNLIGLLKKILEIDGDFEVRVGMMNPKFCYEMIDELIEVFKNKKIKRFIHVPLQSGSDNVLKKMSRPYKLHIFSEIVERFRKEIPEMYIVTDIIVGFPTETEEDFEKTMAVIEETKPNKVNISKFYPRPNTKAKQMKQIPSQVKKERSVRLMHIINKYQLP